MSHPPRTSTYDRALNLLAFRARSEAELRRQLIRKGEPPEDVEAAIVRLLEQRLLNDVDFARQFARAKAVGAGASRFRIVRELGRRGIARSDAEAAVDRMTEDEGIDPAANIQRVAEKKWASLARLDAVTARRRLYAFLARRGFGPDEIAGVVARLGADRSR